MEELLSQLRWMLNLPVTATQDDIVAELEKAIGQIKASDAASTAAAGFSIAALIKSQADKITALTAAVNAPDPSRFVPIATMKSLQDEVTLRAEKSKTRWTTWSRSRCPTAGCCQRRKSGRATWV